MQVLFFTQKSSFFKKNICKWSVSYVHLENNQIYHYSVYLNILWHLAPIYIWFSSHQQDCVTQTYMFFFFKIHVLCPSCLYLLLLFAFNYGHHKPVECFFFFCLFFEHLSANMLMIQWLDGNLFQLSSVQAVFVFVCLFCVWCI